MSERRVKLSRNGRNQALRIPRQFKLPGKDAVIHKEGNRLVIWPAPATSLLELLRTLRPIADDFPPIGELPHDAVEF